MVERQHQTTGVSGFGIKPIGGECLASFAMILSKLQNSCPPFPSLLLCSLITSTLLPFSCLSSAGISPRLCLISPISHFRILFPCDRCGVRAFNYAFPGAPADILAQISPTHGISNGNGNSPSKITNSYGCRLRAVKKNGLLSGSPQETAYPLLPPPFVASRLFHEIPGPCSSTHNVPASQEVR